ncbi:hypothetical protein THM98_001630, partial [Campylobacter coli]|nr:hypothetical protein [Campylobacter coli]
DWEKLKSNFNAFIDKDNYIESLEYLFEFADLDEIFNFLSNYSFVNLGEHYKGNQKIQFLIKLYRFKYSNKTNVLFENQVINDILKLALNKDYKALSYNVHENIIINDNKERVVVCYALQKLIKARMFELKHLMLVIKMGNILDIKLAFVLSLVIDYKLEILKDPYWFMRLYVLISFYKDQGSKIYLDKISKSLELKPNSNIKKPKIALCLWGVCRGNYMKVLQETKKNIIDPLNADVFLHTWDEWDRWPGLCGTLNWHWRFIRPRDRKFFPSIMNGKNLQMYFPNVFNKMSTVIKDTLPLTDILNIINPRSYKIENANTVERSIDFSIEKLKYQFESHHYPLAVFRLRYQMYKVIEILRQYEIKNGTYDYIIMQRFDTSCERKIDIKFLENIDFNEIKMQLGKTGVVDFLLMGKRNSVLKLVNLYQKMIDQQEIDVYKLHTWTEQQEFLWLIEQGILVTQLPDELKVADHYLAYEGMLPYFYNELKADLQQKCIVELKQQKELTDFLDFVYNNKTFFKEYSISTGAVSRVKQHLSYKLGECILNNKKTFFGKVKLPFFIFIIYKNHLKNYSKKQQNLPKLELYSDFDEAQKIKKSEIYRLGYSLIQYKKKYPILFWFFFLIKINSK